MLTSHPDDYEKFEVLDIFVDEERLVAVAFLIARIFSSKTDELLVQKHYLPLYELIVDDDGQAEDQDHPVLLGSVPAGSRRKILRRGEGKLRDDEFQVREASRARPHRPGHHAQPHPQDGSGHAHVARGRRPHATGDVGLLRAHGPRRDRPHHRRVAHHRLPCREPAGASATASTTTASSRGSRNWWTSCTSMAAPPSCR